VNNDEMLKSIALNYHLSGLPDIHIENAIQRYELDWLHALIPMGSRVLDLGIGDGIIFQELVEFIGNSGGGLVTVEGSQDIVEKFSHLESSYVQIICSRFEDLSINDGFDVILASHVLEHVDDPVTLLTNLNSLLKVNGVLVGVVPNRESLHRRVAVAMGIQDELDSLSARDHMVGHQRVYSLVSLVSDLDKAGFEIDSHRGFFVKPLANSQMLDFSVELIRGLLVASDDLPTELCGNIGFVASKTMA